MRAVRLAPPSVEVVDIDEPGGDGELIKVTAVSICASDLAYIRGGSREIAGHEIAGITEDGTAVAVEGMFGCGACAFCERGNYNLCSRGAVDVLGCTVPGGMAEYFRAPSRVLVPLPEGLAPEDACLVEPGSVAWHACVSGGVGPDARVAVVGGGAIGLLAVAAARRLGAPEVALEARYPHQRELGERFGATEPTGLYDVVIETAGSESAFHRCMELIRPQGTVSTIGVFEEGVSWPWMTALVKEARTVTAIGYAGDAEGREFEKVAAMLAEDPDLAASLITHRFGIEDAVEAFDVARERAAGTRRVVVHP